MVLDEVLKSYSCFHFHRKLTVQSEAGENLKGGERGKEGEREGGGKGGRDG